MRSRLSYLHEVHALLTFPLSFSLVVELFIEHLFEVSPLIVSHTISGYVACVIPAALHLLLCLMLFALFVPPL